MNLKRILKTITDILFLFTAEEDTFSILWSILWIDPKPWTACKMDSRAAEDCRAKQISSYNGHWGGG